MNNTAGNLSSALLVGFLFVCLAFPSSGGAICGSPAVDPDAVTVPSELQKAVQRGDTEALYQIGMLYEGSPPATKFLMRAAKQGHRGAQNMIGLSYAHGCRLEQDDIHAYMWLALAVENGLPEAVGNLNFVTARMTAAQIRQAQQLVKEWRSVEKAEAN